MKNACSESLMAHYKLCFITKTFTKCAAGDGNEGSGARVDSDEPPHGARLDLLMDGSLTDFKSLIFDLNKLSTKEKACHS